MIYQERSLGTSLCTTALVLADPSTTRGGDVVELMMDSTVLLSDSMETLSSDNLSNTPCMSCHRISLVNWYAWLKQRHLTSKPSEQVSESGHAKRGEEGSKEGEAGHDGPAHDQHHQGNDEQGAKEEEECGGDEDRKEHWDGLAKEG